MTYAGARGHVLDSASAQALGRAHRVLVGQRALDDVRDDLHIGVAMRTETALRLYAVVVQNAKHAELLSACRPLGKRKVETRREPVGLVPARSLNVCRVAKPRGVRFRFE
jgi:hypothetical protein